MNHQCAKSILIYNCSVFYSIFPSFLLLKNGVYGGSGSINQDHAKINTTTNYKHTALLPMHPTSSQGLKVMKSQQS